MALKKVAQPSDQAWLGWVGTPMVCAPPSARSKL
jgi:hypothetical protein